MPNGARELPADAARNLEAIRQLVTSTKLALVLWQPKSREIITEALAALHGTAALEMTTLVTKQVLLTVLKDLHSIFRGSGNDAHLTEDEADQVQDLVRFAVDLRVGGNFFDAAIQLCLLTALIHAALATITQTTDLGRDYRNIVNLARRFTCKEESVVCRKNDGIARIKNVTSVLFEASRGKSRGAAKTICKEFCDDAPASRLGDDLMGHINRISAKLPELWMLSMPVTGKARRRNARISKPTREGAKMLEREENVPYFFSDADDSEVQDASDDEWNGPSGQPTLNASEKSESADDWTEVPDKQRSAANTREVRIVHHNSRKRRHSVSSGPEVEKKTSGRMSTGQDREGQPRKLRKTSGIKSHVESLNGDNAAVDEGELLDMDSQQFPATDDDADDDGRDSDYVPETDEAKREAIQGPGGEVVRQLHNLASALESTGIPDPLPRAQEDAQNARHRYRGRMVRSYAIAPDARAASPIPETDPPLRRKKKHSMSLPRSSSSSDARPARLPHLNGKYLRTGRFLPHEDELLIAGLRRYGWGLWTDIAANFGDGKYTRAPMSLKDRARTLELMRTEYPAPSFRMRRGRPPRQEPNCQERSGASEVDDDISEDEGESLKPAS